MSCGFRLALLVCALTPGIAFASSPPPAVTVTILHTNDLHSHLRPEKTALGLGGIARIKTAVDEERARTPDALLVDGGDWSEGNIYYTEGAGRETLKMMDQMGYDVAVVGNHDWLNGPDTLLSAIEDSKIRMSLVGANFDVESYSRKDEFKKNIAPYVIREVNGVKIAFIGLGTYEFIYDRFFKPIKVTDPFALTHDLAQDLKNQVDAVVVISHNSIDTNKKLLEAAPDVDLVIGAHDHVQLNKAIVYKRPGASDAWVVETGCWGRNLGRVQMKVTPRQGDNPSKVVLLNYKLRQMDKTVAADPGMEAAIEHLEATIADRMGPIFTDHIADANMEIGRDGVESEMGNFTADAFRQATGADLTIDERNFIYGELHEGQLNSVDVFNSNPAIWNPATQKSWTLKTLPMKGSLLRWVLDIFLGWKQLALSESMVFSGLKAVYSPDLLQSAYHPPALTHPALTIGITPPASMGTSTSMAGAALTEDDLSLSLSPLKSVEIDGKPLDKDKTYLVALGGGIVESIKVIDSIIPGIVPEHQMKDTGIESWRVMSDYARALSPIEPVKVPLGNRLVTEEPDLGVLYNDVSWTEGKSTRDGLSAQVHVTVRNFGDTISSASATVELLANENGSNLTVDPAFKPLSTAKPIRALAPGASMDFDWDVNLPAGRDIYSVTVQILNSTGDIDKENDQVTRWFVPSSSP